VALWTMQLMYVFLVSFVSSLTDCIFWQFTVA
jgi:hypothetical protein